MSEVAIERSAGERAGEARQKIKTLHARRGELTRLIETLHREQNKVADDTLDSDAARLLAGESLPTRKQKNTAIIESRIEEHEREARAMSKAIELAERGLLPLEIA